VSSSPTEIYLHCIEISTSPTVRPLRILKSMSEIAARAVTAKVCLANLMKCTSEHSPIGRPTCGSQITRPTFLNSNTSFTRGSIHEAQPLLS